MVPYLSMATVAKNQRARFDYDIRETLNAGIVLTGAEVKSVKTGSVELAGSYVTVTPKGAQLINCHIGPYRFAPREAYEPRRTRTLLLSKTEIAQLLGKEKGLTIVPLEVFTTKRGLVKLALGIGRGRKKADKREYLKKREADREARSHLSR